MQVFAELKKISDFVADERPSDECAWMAEEMAGVIQLALEDMMNPYQRRVIRECVRNGLLEVAGLLFFVDEDTPPEVIETGTYEVKDGMLCKVVRHRFPTQFYTDQFQFTQGDGPEGKN